MAMDTALTLLADGLQWLVKALREKVVAPLLATVIVGLPLMLGALAGWLRAGWLGLLVFAALGFLAGVALLYVVAQRRARAAETPAARPSSRR
jgi:zinc transporter ZupT